MRCLTMVSNLMETEMTSIKASTLRPGLLVSLKTSLTGNVAYQRLITERDHTTADGKRKEKWETERTINDPVEHEAAVKVRGKVSSLIRGVCAHSAFGLLCPEGDADKLDSAVREARELCEAFNSVAKLTRVSVYVIAGRIAPDDVEAVKAINSEMRDLMSAMENGIKNLDAKMVREAANKARSVGMMLSPEMQARVQLAIDTARASARQIVKAGEQASLEIDKRAIRKIREQRTAFLDLDEGKEIAAPQQSATAVDFEPDSSKPEISAASQKFAALELE